MLDLGQFDVGQFDLGQFLVAQNILNDLGQFRLRPYPEDPNPKPQNLNPERPKDLNT